MPELRTISVENFKLFKDKVNFDFAPITVLTGTNGSGKSSVVQVLHILNNISNKPLNDFQDIKKNYRIQALFFDLDLSMLDEKLGDFSKIISRNSESDTISFSIPYFSGELGELELELQYKLESDLKYGKIISIKVNSVSNRTSILSLALDETDANRSFKCKIDLGCLWRGYLEYIENPHRMAQALYQMNQRAVDLFGGNLRAIEEGKEKLQDLMDILKASNKDVVSVTPNYQPLNIFDAYEEYQEDGSRFSGFTINLSDGQKISMDLLNGP